MTILVYIIFNTIYKKTIVVFMNLCTPYIRVKDVRANQCFCTFTCECAPLLIEVRTLTHNNASDTMYTDYVFFERGKKNRDIFIRKYKLLKWYFS